MDRSALRRLINGVERLPVIPRVATRMASELAAPAPDLARLASFVAADPGASAIILRMAPARRSTDFDLRQTVLDAGLEAVRAAFGGATAVLSEDAESLWEGLWRHSLASGLCAERVARLLGNVEPPLAYAAGLLHDLGELALLSVPAAPQSADAEPIPEQTRAEHVLAGKWLAERWRLPRVVIDTVWLHHHPPGTLPQGPFPNDLIAVVRLADALAQGRPFTDGEPSLVPRPFYQSLGLSAEDLNGFRAETEAAFTERLQLLAFEEAGAESPARETVAVDEQAARPAQFEAENANLRRRAGRFRALHELNQELTPGLSLTEVAGMMAQAARSTFGIVPGMCFVLDAKGRLLRGKVWEDAGGSLRDLTVDLEADAGSDGAVIPVETGLDAAARSAIDGLGLGRDAGGWHGAQLVDIVNRGGLVAVPLAAGGRSYGQLLFDLNASRLKLNEEEWSELMAFASACGTAIARYHAEEGQEERIETLAEALAQPGSEAIGDEPVEEEPLDAVAVSAGVARALHGPLTFISSRLQRLLATTDDARSQEALGSVLEQSCQVQKIVADLLAFMQSPPPAPEPTLIGYLLRGLVGRTRKRYQARNIQIQECYAERLPRVLVDRSQVEVAFLELLENAREACEACGGGTVTVETEAASDVTGVVVRISDTGPGIPPKVLENVFEPFFTTSSSSGRAGLGLALCRRIVEQHHGAVQIDSAAGQGTAVTMTFPCAAASGDSSTKEPPPESRRVARGSHTVLVVDSNEHLREVLSEALRSRGFRVLNSGDGAVAMRLAAERRVDLMLLDVEMPECGGIQMLAELRRQGRSFPIIAMVGPKAHGDAAEALRGGARACLRKPFDLSRLYREIELALGTLHMG